MYTVIVPTRTDALLARALQSICCNAGMSLGQMRRYLGIGVVVADNGLSADFRRAFPELAYVQARDPWSFSDAVNRAASEATRGSARALLILNDDAMVLGAGLGTLVGQARRVLEAASAGRYGVVGLGVERGAVGNPDQRVSYRGGGALLRPTDKTICFLATFVGRSCWDQLGGLDAKTFGHQDGRPLSYGFEDADFCRRAAMAGWRSGVTDLIRVQHGLDGDDAGMSTTFREVYPERQPEMFREGLARFEGKWGKLAPGEPA